MIGTARENPKTATAMFSSCIAILSCKSFLGILIFSRSKTGSIQLDRPPSLGLIKQSRYHTKVLIGRTYFTDSDEQQQLLGILQKAEQEICK